MRRFVTLSTLIALLAAGCDAPAEPPPEDARSGAESEVDLAFRALDPLRARIDEPRAGERLDGPTTLYHPDGVKSGEGNYVDGEKDGPWTFWYAGGTVRWQGSYSRGVPHGDERAYHTNGQIHYEGELRRGKRHGLYRYWYENGRLELECTFEDDVRNGPCRRWTRDGTLDRETSGRYERGKKVAEL